MRTRPWWGRRWVIVGGSVLALVIVIQALNSGDDESATGGATEAINGDNPAAVDESAEAPAEDEDAIGQTAKDVGKSTTTTAFGSQKDSARDESSNETPEDAADSIATTVGSGSQNQPTGQQPTTQTGAQPSSRSGLTPSQQNAVKSAKSYLDFKGFSRQGLIDQLSSEFGDKFSVEDATVAVDSLTVDWNAEAVESAESYLDFKGFSRQGLIDQLSSDFGDQFTDEQATYAVDAVGPDWMAEAAEAAQSYLDFKGFSRAKA